MDFNNSIIAFFDGSTLKLVHVSEPVKNNLQVKNEHGKQFRIPQKNVVALLNHVSYETFVSQHESLTEQVKTKSEEVEVELLWEMVVDDSKDFLCDELAENYFGDHEPLSIVSLFKCVADNSVYFKRKGLHFIPRSQVQVDEQIQVLKRKQEKAAFQEKVIPWLEEVTKSKVVDEVPEEFKQYLNLLEIFLYNKKQNEATKTLAQICGDSKLRETVYEILVKCSVIDSDLDPHLVLAGIEEKFSNKVILAADEVEESYDNTSREDFSKFLTFSIDDEETQDVDDALSLEKLENGHTKVGVHISDVSAYIEESGILDNEASNRVTSIYLPTKTVHMFPSSLSQNRISLVAGELRPAMSFIIEFNEQKEVVDWEVKLTEIKVDHKLSYDAADEMLLEDSELGSTLFQLNELAKALTATRMVNGAAMFNRPEQKIRVVDGQVTVKMLKRNSASRNFIGEFMILANSVAATFCVRNDVPIIFRTQDKPEGLPEMNPDVYDPIIFEQCIKCMKKSRLSLHPQSHGGLGVDFYTQLTSPIRRYTDLIMQRQLAAYLRKEDLAYQSEELMSVIAAAEAVNSEVKEVQKQSENFWIHTYIQENMLEQEYEATVISKAAGGYMIELSEICFKTKFMTQETFKGGDKIKVVINEVKVNRGFLGMSLVS